MSDEKRTDRELLERVAAVLWPDGDVNQESAWSVLEEITEVMQEFVREPDEVSWKEARVLWMAASDEDRRRPLYRALKGALDEIERLRAEARVEPDETGQEHDPQSDFVMVFSDETAEERSAAEMNDLVDDLREAANPHGFDISSWGKAEAIRDSLNRRFELDEGDAGE